MARLINSTIACLAGLSASAATSAPGRVSEVRFRASADQLLELADHYGRAGETGKANAILEALSADPNPDIRNEARFRRAKLLVAEGQSNRAAVLLREIVDERPDAVPVRLELAGVLDKIGDKEGAWRQVRAAQAAGLPPAVARIVDRYSEALRAQRPFGASVEIALAPDSNINRATRSDTLGTVLGDFEISEEGKAKSGTGLALHAQAYRRLPIGADNSILVRVSSFADLYKHKDFNDIAADIAGGPELALGRDRLQLELGATQRWYGQKPYMRLARLAATFSHPFGSRTLVRLSGSAALVDNRVNDLQDGKTYTGHIDVERALTPTTGIAASVDVARESLDDPGYSTKGWRAGLTAWRDMGRMTLTLAGQIGRLHADERLLLFPDRRSDRYSRLTLGATFRQLQLNGFAPVVRFSLERNRSSVEFYDYRRARTELGIVRAF